MKIKILESPLRPSLVGNEYLVNEYDVKSGNLRFHINSHGWIRSRNCVITELPESFCVKRCHDGQTWEKYIQWLNKTYNHNFNGFCYHGYYGNNDKRSFDDNPFGTEIHIDDMIKHIDFYSEPMVVNYEDTIIELQKQEVDMNNKEDMLEYARRNYPIGTKYRPLDCIGISCPVEYVSKFEARYWIGTGTDRIEVGDGLIYCKGKWAEIIDEVKEEEFDMSTSGGRLAYAKKYYPIGTEILNHKGEYRKITGIPRQCYHFIDVQAKDDTGEDGFYPDLYTARNGWVSIIDEVKEEEKMETQKLSRQGLKEIHSVACSHWKTVLERYGANSPLEDYIVLTQEEVNEMFYACTRDQLSIVSKYLNQDDGSVDVKTLHLRDNHLIAIRQGGEYKHKAFGLNTDYDWILNFDNEGGLCLIPTKKKQSLTSSGASTAVGVVSTATGYTNSITAAATTGKYSVGF